MSLLLRVLFRVQGLGFLGFRAKGFKVQGVKPVKHFCSASLFKVLSDALFFAA